MESSLKENENIANNIKELTPSKIRNYDKEKLKTFINKNYKLFFDNINIDALKAISDDVFNYLSEECIKSLKIENIKSLVEIEKIEFLPIFVLNNINKELFKDIPDNFYRQIQSNHIEKANKDILNHIITLKKLNLLNNKQFETFCKIISFNDLEKQNVFTILDELQKRNKFKYLTGENYLNLENYINNEELEPYLKELKTITYLDNKNKIDSYYNYKNNSLLDENDIKSDEEIVIKYEEIEDKIEEYINEEKYDLLKIYCNKCSRNVNNNEKMINTLNSLLKYSKESIYDLIDEFEIRKILIVLSTNMADNIKHYVRMKQIIIDMQHIDIKEPDEFLTKIMKYSEIVNGKSFDIDFREMLAEENMKYMEYVINKFYNGSEKNAAPNNLKKIYVEIINDYITVIGKKYSISKTKIINGLQSIDINNQEEELSVFINSLNKYEKIYYDLLLKLVLEMPNSESWIESVSTPIFKFIRDVILAVGTFKLASLTGSKMLIALSASVGGTMILKDVKDEIIKNYFSLDDEGRKIYHLNRKNSPKTRFSILTQKIKEKYRKFMKPVKKIMTSFFDQNILHLKERPKIGLDKYIKNTENLEKKCEEFRNQELKLYFKYKKIIKKMKFQQILSKIIKKLEKKRGIPGQINQYFKFKTKIISKLNELKQKKLKEKYPEYKDPSFSQKVVQIGGSIKDFGYGTFKSFANVFSFGLTAGFFAKKNNLENTLEMIKNINYNEFKNKLDNIQKQKEDDDYIIKYEKIKYLTKSSSTDFDLFNILKTKNSNEIREIEEEIVHLKFKINNKPKLINKNDIILNSKKEDYYEKDGFENFDENSELNINLLDNEESEIDDNVICTKSH